MTIGAPLEGAGPGEENGLILSDILSIFTKENDKL